MLNFKTEYLKNEKKLFEHNFQKFFVYTTCNDSSTNFSSLVYRSKNAVKLSRRLSIKMFFVHTFMHQLQTKNLTNKRSFLNSNFSESLNIHVLIAQQILDLQLYRSKNKIKLSWRLRKKQYTCNFLVL
jgi:hypothetical protein